MPKRKNFGSFPNKIDNVSFNYWKEESKELEDWVFSASTLGIEFLPNGWVFGGVVGFSSKPNAGDSYFVCVEYEIS